MKNPTQDRDETYQNLLRRLETSAPANVREMIARLLSVELEAPAVRISGKFPTGPGCYGEDVRPFKGSLVGIDVISRAGGKNKVTVLTPEGRERCREAGRKGRATLTRRLHNPDMAEYAAELIKGGCDQ